MRPKSLTSKTVKVMCRCGKQFSAYRRTVDKGADVYCSTDCRNSDPERSAKIGESLRKFSEPLIQAKISAKRLRCRRCGELKEKAEFVKDGSRPYGYFPWCKKCHVEAQAKYKHLVAADPSSGSGTRCLTCLVILSEDAASNRRYCSSRCKERAKRWKEFGLSPEEFRKLTESGNCPLCGCHVKRWVVDHNHKTGETTGPVCQRCNQYLLVGCSHNLDIAKALVEYLENPPVRKFFGEHRYIGPQSTSQIHRKWMWTGKEEESYVNF